MDAAAVPEVLSILTLTALGLWPMGGARGQLGLLPDLPVLPNIPAACSLPSSHVRAAVGVEKGNLSAGRQGARTAGRSCLLPETGFWHSKPDGSPRDRVWHPKTDSSLVSFDFISTQFGRG